MDRPDALIAFDVEANRPGCVLLQALFGGTIERFQELFPTDTWTTDSTNIRLYRVNEEELEVLSERCCAAHKCRRIG